MRKEITLLLVLDGASIKKEQKLYCRQLAEKFAGVIGVINKKTDARWISDTLTDSIFYSPEQGRVDALNCAIKKVNTPFVMHLESDERLTSSELPQILELDTCYRALIDITGLDESQQNYQIRLFPTPDQQHNLFDGFTIADINRSFQALKWELAEPVISIHKLNPLFKVSDVQAEASEVNADNNRFFWQAIIDSEDQNYHRAEESFRKVLKSEKLVEFDLLAALNGLSNALVEQHKLKEATRIAKESIDACSYQRAPYLTLYKVYELAGDSEKSYHVLSEYLDVLSYASHANMDVRLSLSECHYLMADTAFKKGYYERAFDHYEWYYEINKGKVSQPILEKLFIYAIELKNYEKSVRYFNNIFENYIPDNLTEDMSARLLESLSLFMDNEWYEFVGEIYEKLVTHDPDNNQLLNRWITILIKSKQIDKAQELLNRKKAS